MPSTPSPSAVVGWLRRYLRGCIAIDSRALALFRMAIASLIFADLILRSRNFHFYYTENGVVPQYLARQLSADHAVSIFHLTTSTELIAALFVLHALAAVALFVGYRTRLAMVVSFLFIISLDHHNPLVLSYADILFRLLAFWAIFLPLGERWSIDAVHRERVPRTQIASAATFFVLAQLVYMYVTNGLIKSVSTTWRQGEAAPLVLGLDEMTYLLGDTVRHFPELLAIGGLLWYYMMVFGFLLLLTRGWVRMALLTLYIGGHLSFALTVRIGAFAYVALAGLILFVQTPVWDRCWLDLRRVDTLDDHLERARRRLIVAASAVPDPRSDGILTPEIRQRTYAVTMAAVVATMLFLILTIGAQAGMAAYEHDDHHDQTLEHHVEDELRATLVETHGVREVNTVASGLGIDQPLGWGVFAPEPRTTDRYYVFPAVTESGEEVDVFSDRPMTYDRPHDELQKQHDTYRQRFYMNSIRRGGYSNDAAKLLAEYHCERWEADHGETLGVIDMYEVTEAVTEETIVDHEGRDRSYTHVYRHVCDGGADEPVPRPPEDG